MDTTLLARRIRQGRAWLAVNSFTHCQKTKKPYSHDSYLKALQLYEQLVDEYTKLGLVETDAWILPKGEELSDSEIEHHLS